MEDVFTNIICPQCKGEWLKDNRSEEKVCPNCVSLNSGDYDWCPECDGLKKKEYRTCLACYTGYRRA